MDYENDFYLSCDSTRISKILAHYELFKMTMDIPGAIVECGVFKGTSLARFAMFRELFGNTLSKKNIGFDVFGEFPETQFEADQKIRKKFVESAGNSGVSVEQMQKILEHKNCNQNLELVAGDICETLPRYF
jgi:hypothetical protein